MSDFLAVEESGIIAIKATKSVFKKAAKKVADPINGTKKDDVLYGTNFDDTINGNAGNDVLYGGWGDDKLNGGKGNDKLYGSEGDDLLDGGAGNDKLYGGDGDDTLKGGAGNDKLYGGDGDDIINGGKGDDRLYGGTGADTFEYANGDGNDRICDFGSCTDALKITKGTISAITRKNARNDVVLTIGKGSVRINSLGTKGMNFIDSFGTTGYIWVARNSNAPNYDRYFNYIEAQSDFKGTLDAAMLFGKPQDNRNYEKNIDMGRTTGSTTVLGSSYIENFNFGWEGDAVFKGNATIKNFNAEDDRITFLNTDYKGSASGNDVVLNLDNGGKIKIIGAAGKEIHINNTWEKF